MTASDDDWRLRNQEKYLKGATLTRRRSIRVDRGSVPHVEAVARIVVALLRVVNAGDGRGAESVLRGDLAVDTFRVAT